MKRIHVACLLALFLFSLQALSQTLPATISGSKGTDYRILGIKVPVKKMWQWDVSRVAAANMLEYDFAKYADFIRAMKNGRDVLSDYPDDPFETENITLEPETRQEIEREVRRTIEDNTYLFKDGDFISTYPSEIFDVFIDQFLNFPGSTACLESVRYTDGLISELRFKDAVFDYMNPEYQSDQLNIEYDGNGLPVKITGKSNKPESGDDGDIENVEIKISDYMFDDKGNWTRRRILSGVKDIIQFRDYEY